jgi:hypothetical protein
MDKDRDLPPRDKLDAATIITYMLKNAIAIFATVLAVVAASAGVLFPLRRAYIWLRYGYGLSYSGLDFLADADMRGVERAVLEIKWLGIQKALV